MSHALKFDIKEGTKIWFELHNGRQYEGTFIENSKFRIRVYNTVQLPERTAIYGHTYFYKKEILIINEVNSDESASDSKEEDEKGSEPTKKFDHFEYWTKNSKTWSYLSVLNEDYDSCIKNLSACETIAVHATGNNGRMNDILLLALATKFNIYIIDISICGAEIFSNGIKELLESRTTHKVVFNSALLVDCLYHLYNVKLQNFFDVQVADKILLKNTEPMRELSCLLIDYIHMPEKEAKKLDDHVLKTLMTKPIKKTFLIEVVKSVAYLIPMKNAMEEMMLKDFKSRNDYCLNRSRERSPISALVNTNQLLDELNKMKVSK